MKNLIKSLLEEALNNLVENNTLPRDHGAQIHVEKTRQSAHGDLASNIALVLAKAVGKSPREIAGDIVGALPRSSDISRVELAGPGFINFFLSPSARWQQIEKIRAAKATYGTSNTGRGKKVMVEFVSANPTGPLHVGHGRGAAYGDALARVLKAAGYSVHSEYYVNDAGRQMDILALSVWVRYLELCGLEFSFPKECYQGDYIWDIAATLHRQEGGRLQHDLAILIQGLPNDPEARIDRMVEGAKHLLGEADYLLVFDLAKEIMVDLIRQDLNHFRVNYDQWFSERSLVDSGAIKHAIEVLEERGHLYQEGGATWFRSTAFGDEKDRVVLRANGSHTYFAADIAYHLNKVERGFEWLINIWGADHHGYVTRVKSAFQALGGGSDALDVLLVQFAVLYRGGEKVSMSTRSGDFVTLRALCKEVGEDAARFFYALRKPEQHMDFDLDLAKEQSNENPVYYVQYAHARICSVFRQMETKGIEMSDSQIDFSSLVEPEEMNLIDELSRYPEVVAKAAAGHEPHQLAYYLRETATCFHAFYNAHHFLNAEAAVREPRLALIDAVRQVIANGLGLLGVSAPEMM
ncbi:MAG: arginine--tRNA ligase [Arenicellales bacterium]|nr:arginine--tRNA ligase [Arenicellales bacterium]